MTCCGSSRAAFSQSQQPPAKPGNAARPPGQIAINSRPEVLYFQYVGRTSLVVQGTFSRAIYRFPAAGIVLAVDPRDAPGMAAVPNLRRVRPPE